MNLRDEKPCVSVIIPAYNAAKTLERAVESVVEQMGLLEIIIVDDCSSDNTLMCARGLMEQFPRIVIIENDKNKGASAARNMGIEAAAGHYIAFLDADDMWQPGKLEKQLTEITTHDDVVLVSCDSLQLSPEGDVLKRGHENRPPAFGEEAWKTLLAYNFIPTPTVLIKRADLLAVGCFNVELPVAEDLDVWIKIALLGKVVIVRDVFVHYYDYPGSLMKSEGEQTEAIIMKMICDHLEKNNDRMTPDEINYVLSCRNFDFGLQHYFDGKRKESIPYFIKSIKRKYCVFKSLQYIVRSLLTRKYKLIESER